jgi:hypothetical protein
MKKNLLGGAAVVVILIGVSAYNYFTGAEIGGTCQWNDDCKGNLYGKFGTQCLDVGNGTGGFCTNTCKTAADCPAGWSCEDVDYFENDVKKGVNRVCVKPAPTAAQQTAPGAPASVPIPAPAPVAPAPPAAQ